MEANSIQEHGERETRDESAGAISAGKMSRKREKIPTDLSMLLRILQQALFNYQAAGGKVFIPDVGNVGTAFLLIGVSMDSVGNLSLPTANIANNVVGSEE